MAQKKFLTVLLLIVLTPQLTQAAHLLGGDFTYKFVGYAGPVARYQVTAKVYRNCNEGATDTNIRLNIYEDGTNARLNTSPIRVDFFDSSDVSEILPGCSDPNVCVQEWVFIETIELPINKSYHVTWGRCCRDNLITNLNNPQSAGQLWAVFIPASLGVQNNSPDFLNLPVPYVCAGRPTIFNHNAFDPDGDSLVFSFETPYRAGTTGFCVRPSNAPNTCANTGIRPNYLTVNWGAGFSASMPFGANSTATIDSRTGEISLTANSAGRYVIAIEVKEYRKQPNGSYTYLGSVRRDMEFFVVNNCSNNPLPEFDTVATSFVHDVTVGDTLCFNIKGKDIGDELTLTSSGTIFNNNAGFSPPYATLSDKTEQDSVLSEFCWIPDCDQARAEPYLFTVTINDDNCNQILRTFSVRVDSMPKITPPNLRCADIVDSTTVKLSWIPSPFSLNYQTYKIYRREGTSGPYSLVKTLTDYTIDTWTDVAATDADSISYSYYIQTINDCSRPSDRSTTLQTIVIRDSSTSNQIRLFWDDFRVGKPGETTYKVYANEDNAGYQLLTTTTNDSLVTGPPKCNFNAQYMIVVDDDSISCSSNSNETEVSLIVDNIAPDSIALYRATATPSNTVNLYFDSSASSDVTQYYIYRSTTTSGGFQLIDSVAGGSGPITWEDLTVSIDTDDPCYRISAKDSCGNTSVFSRIHCPVNLTGTAGNKASLLSWNAYTGWTPDTVMVEWWDNSQWVTLDTLAGSAASYTHSDLPCGLSQHYRIRAFSSEHQNFFTYSDSIEVIPFDTVKPSKVEMVRVSFLSSTSAEVVFKKVPEPDTKTYQVYASLNNGPSILVGVVNSTNQDTITYIHSGINGIGNKFCYFVRAVDSCSASNVSPDSDVFCTVNMQSSTGGCVPQIQLSWNRETSFPPGITSFDIYRSQSGGPFTLINTLPGTDSSYLDQNVLLDTNYCYYVEAMGAGSFSISDTTCQVPALYPLPNQGVITVASVTQTGTTNGSVTVNWEVIPPTDQLSRGYKVLHATQPNGPYNLIHTENDVNIGTYVHSGINTTSGTAHYYRLIIFDLCGKDGDTSVAHRVINLSVENQNLQVKLDWEPYEGWPVGGYAIERSDDGVNYSPIVNLPGNALTYTDTNISCNVTYDYRINATDVAAVRTTLSNIVSVTTFDTIAPNAIPLFVASVSSTSTTTGSIGLNYNAAAEKNRQGYRIYRSTNGGSYLLQQDVPTATQGLLSYLDQNLNTRGNRYRYRVTAYDSCGNESVVSTSHQPVNLSAQAISQQNDLAWTTYKGFTNLSYEVERLIMPAATWNTVAVLTANDSIWSDNNVTCNQTYYYRIKTTNTDFPATVSFSDTIAVTAFEDELPDPAVMRRVTVTETGTTNGETAIEWTPSPSPDVTGYIIYRKRPVDAVWNLVTTVGLVNTYTDNAIDTRGEVYEYRVVAEDACGNLSTPSDHHGTINLTATVNTLSVDLSWTPYIGETVDKYYIINQGAVLDSVDGNDLTYEITNLTCKQTNVLQISARLSTGLTSNSDTAQRVADDVNPPPPTRLKTATFVEATNQVRVVWEPSPTIDASGYILYKRDKEADTWQFLEEFTSIDDTVYLDDEPLTDGISYCYVIAVKDQCDNVGNFSNVGCTIVLTGIAENQVNVLQWTPYEEWDLGVRSYTLMLSEDGMDWEEVRSEPDGVFEYNHEDLSGTAKEYCYQIIANERGGLGATSASNVVCLKQQPVIWIPNAFSPKTSLGTNDTFGPLGAHFSKFEMRIFNRWGEVIFISSDAKPYWDGLDASGNVVPQGAYGYDITIFDENNRKSFWQGSVTIIN